MDPDGNLPGQIFLLIALIAIGAFFSMSELAIVTLNDAKLRKMAADGHKKARILTELIAKPSRFLATIQIGVTFSGFFAAAVAADSFMGYLTGAFSELNFSSGTARSLSLAAVTLLLCFLVLVFGDTIPKRIAMQHYEKIAFGIAVPLSVFAKIERPFVALISSSANGILRLLGINPDMVPEQVTEEEIRMLVEVGGESGSIAESDKDMINNIFELDDTSAVEIMTHRTEIVALEKDASLSEIIAVATENGYSRIPVFEDDLDSIVGILYVKDLLSLITQSPDAAFRLEDYMREPMYVHESVRCSSLMSEFKQKKIQMAVVVDEYGGTAGLVTMEDLLEAIVGSIQDEYDDEEEEIAQSGENRYVIDGLADLEDICKVLGLSPDEDDLEEFETVGGFIVNKLGYIPGGQDRPSITVGDIMFTVLEMEDRRIAKLSAERMSDVTGTETSSPGLEIGK